MSLYPSLKLFAGPRLRFSRVCIVGLAICGTARAATGDLDSEFGDHGRVRIDLAGGYEELATARQHDGKLVLARTDPGSGQIRVVRLEVNGSVDTAFAAGGNLVTDFGSAISQVRAVLQQTSGRLLLAGSTSVTEGSPRDMAILALKPDGSTDTTFGDAGRVVLDIQAGASDLLTAMISAANGDLLLTGSVQSSGSALAVIRLTADGQYRTAFGDGGKVLLNLDAATFGRGIAEQPDGNLLVCGSTGSAETDMTATMLAARLLPDGSRDSGFNGDGIISGTFGPATACAVQTDGAILLATHRQEDFDHILRFTASGEPDATFGDDGAVGGAIGCLPSSCDNAWTGTQIVALSVLANGDIVAGGIGPHNEPAVAVHAQNGAPVEGFGPGGVRTVDTGHDADFSFAFVANVVVDQRSVVLAGATDSNATVAQLNLDDRPGASVVGLFRIDTLYRGDAGAERHRDGLFSVRRSGSLVGPVSVQYRTVDGSATAGADYETTEGTLSWADGDDEIKYIEVPVLDDDVEDDAETYSMVLEAASGAALSADSLTLAIDDSAPVATNPPPVSSPGPSGGGGGALEPGALLLLLLVRASRRRRSTTRLPCWSSVRRSETI